MDSINIIGDFCNKLQEQVNKVAKENEQLKVCLFKIKYVCAYELNNDIAIDKILEILSQADDVIVEGDTNTRYGG